ncbi:glycosyltransferase family 2 protein [Xylophilus sp.]|uniref:glycosyltransferase family 2 protein n=1 Tax=Xylophilus sp. TaxID=2653893 RepID=UPI0013BC7621|nr:glycosyltransferase family 2 protein [Xylophilus sp.]KAF1050317.1 MAG: SPBc2 prophage-derived glycosyltransferase SunS [Xylophilus sp.]
MNDIARPRLTIGVLTLNEERHIEACLKSAAFADEIIVVDSGSTDRTVAIAEGLGAQVHTHADWQGFAEQRNRLLRHATGDYVFFVDADEQVTDALRHSVQAAVASGAQAVWTIRWSVVAYGRELRWFLGQAPIERMFPRARLAGFTGVVHERAELPGDPLPRRALAGRLRHFSRESVRDSLYKLAQYSMLGAAKRAEAGKRGGIWRGIASGTAIFIRLYILRLGFLGGGPGFLFCFFIALECFFRYAALHYDRASLDAAVRR